jgi:hypothetical protein
MKIQRDDFNNQSLFNQLLISAGVRKEDVERTWQADLLLPKGYVALWFYKRSDTPDFQEPAAGEAS